MNSNTNSAYRAKRNARWRFCQRVHRSIGLECLENRTVFASDLSPLLDDVGSCFASPVQESRVTQSNIAVEVSNSQLSLIQGDVIRIEVPESILLQLTDRDSYELQVFFSENYFSDETNTRGALAAHDVARQTIADTLLLSQPLSSQPISSQQGLGLQALGELYQSHRNVLAMPSSNNDNLFGSYSSIVLASLTASTDFEGTVRLFDFVPVTSQPSTNGALEGLPNEVRIEPRVTVPTAMRDPGATLVKTIVVNRAASGLSVSQENSRIESATNEGSATAALPEAPTIAAPTENSSEQQQSRSVVTLKTIDISMARRNETSRPWMRSSTIPNPANQQESGSKRTASESAPDAVTSIVKTEAESNKPTRRELRVPGTQLQPVEFLLAKSTVDEEGVMEGDMERILATDRVFRAYSDEESVRTLQYWGEAGPFPSSLLQFEQPTSKWLTAKNDPILEQDLNEIALLSQLANLYFTPIHGGVASNKESWKNVLRSASESTAGQAMLASLTTLAVQLREISTFGTKSAWEFVPKTTPNSPL